ncbi:MAG: hypothetical protein QXJ17_04410 [Nitrososphaeria archaeon]
MVSKSNPQRVKQYLISNNYLEVLIFLIISLDNLRERMTLLDKNITGLKEQMDKISKESLSDPQNLTPDNPAANTMFKALHYTELEIIQKINILTELLAIYYHTIRIDVRKLPTCIGRKDFPPKELYKEFEYFNRQSVNDVWANFHYPNVRNFKELCQEQRETLQNILDESAKKILECFKKIYLFQRNFRNVYNKYKHSLSEITGIFGIDINVSIIRSHIFVRHKENDGVKTALIPVSPEEVEYFTEIASCVYRVMLAMIEGAILYIVNEEKDCVPRRVFTTAEKYTEILDKIQSCIMPDFKSKMIVKPPDQKDIGRIGNEIKEKHIYWINGDVLDLNSLLKEGVDISKS